MLGKLPEQGIFNAMQLNSQTLTECMQTADEVIKTRPTGSRSQSITEHLTEANRD